MHHGRAVEGGRFGSSATHGTAPGRRTMRLEAVVAERGGLGWMGMGKSILAAVLGMVVMAGGAMAGAKEHVVEGEGMKVVSHRGEVSVQPWAGVSGGKQLWWRNAAVGDRLRAEFRAPAAARYRVVARFTRAEDYGRFAAAVNGSAAEGEIDLYQPRVMPGPEVDLGVHELRAGVNTIEFRIVGRHANAKAGHMMGLDYVSLKEPGEKARPYGLVRAGEFRKVYDPGVRENKPWYINDHCFVRGTEGRWHLFGITREEPAKPIDEVNFAHATAGKLGGPWEKQAFALTADFGRYGEVHLWAPHVVEHQGTYYMYYCAGAGRGSREKLDGANYRMHLATSKDLKTWVRHEGNPLFTDGWDARDPFVIRIGEKWVMYYTANDPPTGGNHVVAVRESDDLVKWSAERRVVFRDPKTGTTGGPTESPFVVKRGKWYYLFVGPRHGYVGTDVFRSEDPYHFDIKDMVGHIESHAAEVVQDEAGRWWVSHAGWGQGGVFVAPLEWAGEE